MLHKFILKRGNKIEKKELKNKTVSVIHFVGEYLQDVETEEIPPEEITKVKLSIEVNSDFVDIFEDLFALERDDSITITLKT